jgi:hypothetical protein
MRRLVTFSFLGAVACAAPPSAPPGGDPTPNATSPLFEEAAPPSSVARDTPASGLLEVDTPALVGRLVVNAPRSLTRPSAYCLDDGRHYRGAPVRVAGINVFAQGSVTDLAGKVVLVRGSRQPSLLAALTDEGPCPADDEPLETPQMRSDWVSPEGGFKSTRAKLGALPAFRATSVTPVDLGAQIGSDGDRVVVELKNPFAVAMSSLRLRAHYEGGPGKPMPRFEPIDLVLAPGASRRIELKAHVEAGPTGRTEGEPRGTYHLASVDIDGKLGHIELDVRIVANVPRDGRKD